MKGIECNFCRLEEQRFGLCRRMFKKARTFAWQKAENVRICGESSFCFLFLLQRENNDRNSNNDTDDDNVDCISRWTKG